VISFVETFLTERVILLDNTTATVWISGLTSSSSGNWGSSGLSTRRVWVEVIPGNFGIPVTIACPPGGRVTCIVCANQTVPRILSSSAELSLILPYASFIAGWTCSVLRKPSPSFFSASSHKSLHYRCICVDLNRHVTFHGRIWTYQHKCFHGLCYTHTDPENSSMSDK
jgi:hypothetical protein